MVRLSKLRRVLKWVATAGSGLIAVLWVWSIRAPTWVDKRDWYLDGAGGWVTLGFREIRYADADSRRYEVVVEMLLPERGISILEPRPWSSLGSYGLGIPSVRRSDVVIVRDVSSRRQVRRLETAIHAPCWFLLLLFGAPTALLWWRDRRIPPGHCQTCGYNLTGNVSGRCPECGTAVGGAGE